MIRKQARRFFSEDFKAQAVDLVETQSESVTETTRRLGINRCLLTRWRRERSAAANGDGGASVVDDRDLELRRLQAENRRLREERTVLKKPRPCSPMSRVEVPIHGRGEGQSQYWVDGPGAADFAQRFLRLVQSQPAAE